MGRLILVARAFEELLRPFDQLLPVFQGLRYRCLLPATASYYYAQQLHLPASDELVR